MKPRLAAQLYTVRDFTQTRASFAETLRKVAEIGYDSVQLSAVGALNEMPPADVYDLLVQYDLSAPLTHRSWEEISERTDECIALHQALGAELVAVGSIPGAYSADGLDGYRRFADEAQEPIEKLGEAGLKFAYHNHAFEFDPIDGVAPFEVLMSSPNLLFEIDTYWVVYAGADLLDLISRLSGRIPMIHLKDMSPDKRMAPIGEGTLNWPAILPACLAAGTEVFAVEQDDCYGRDPFDCLASSWRFLQNNATF